MYPANGVDLDAPEGTLRSVVLRATYTAEHEWGVQELQRDLGCDPARGPGLPGRTAPPAPEPGRCWSQLEGRQDEQLLIELPVEGRPGATRIRTLRQTTSYHALYLGRDHPHADASRLHTLASQLGRRYRPDALVAGAWDTSNCLIVGYDAGIAHIESLTAALRAGDLALWSARPSEVPQRRAGLMLALVSALPPVLKADLEDKDNATARLETAAMATGIPERLAAMAARHDGRYQPFATLTLTPEWRTPDAVSRHVVRFWLTPLAPGTTPGWYTVEELDAWLAGRAPLPPKKVGGKDD